MPKTIPRAGTASSFAAARYWIRRSVREGEAICFLQARWCRATATMHRWQDVVKGYFRVSWARHAAGAGAHIIGCGIRGRLSTLARNYIRLVINHMWPIAHIGVK